MVKNVQYFKDVDVSDHTLKELVHDGQLDSHQATKGEYVYRYGDDNCQHFY